MARLGFVKKHNLSITWSRAVVQEVARSYTELPKLGFAAFQKSRVYMNAEDKISAMVAMQPNASAHYLYVDYCKDQLTSSMHPQVVVKDLFGQPDELTRAKALAVLQSLNSPESDEAGATTIDHDMSGAWRPRRADLVMRMVMQAVSCDFSRTFGIIGIFTILAAFLLKLVIQHWLAFV